MNLTSVYLCTKHVFPQQVLPKRSILIFIKLGDKRVSNVGRNIWRSSTIGVGLSLEWSIYIDYSSYDLIWNIYNIFSLKLFTGGIEWYI